MKFENKKKPAAEKEYNKMISFSIISVRDTKYGVFFDMRLNDVRINDCIVRTNKQSGEAFISLPSKKGKGDEYYPVVSFYFDPEDQDSILQAVQDKLNE